MNKIKPVRPDEFIHILQTKDNEKGLDHLAYYASYIDQAINYAIGPYCWFIPDTSLMKVVAASDNIRQLTPFTKEEWVGETPPFMVKNAHPEDAYYLLSAIAMGTEMHEKLPAEKRGKIRVNIYCRMLDAARNYRWTLIQFPARYYNAEGRVESALMLMTDLSSFKTLDTPMMSVIDNNNNEHQYFKVMMDNKSLVPFSLPHITLREQEVMQLMVKGLNTPLIAAALNISYHTVENHKRNLRRKTGTKTAAELVYFLKNNCLI